MKNKSNIFAGIKNAVIKTPIWIRISYSLFYQKIRNPDNYTRLVNELNFYKTLLKEIKPQIIFDVGANIGNKSDIFSKIANKVLAFEPSQNCINILDSRFKNSNVHLFRVAIGSKKGVLDFYEIKDNTLFNSLSKKHLETTVKERNVIDINLIEPVKVPVETVEYYIATYGKPDYIKIDVEGYEIEVIKGLKSLIRLISFEANLPEFLNEASEAISYLSRLSKDKYAFKFAVDTSFLTDDYVSKDEAIGFLQSTPIRYLEVYARLEK